MIECYSRLLTLGIELVPDKLVVLLMVGGLCLALVLDCLEHKIVIVPNVGVWIKGSKIFEKAYFIYTEIYLIYLVFREKFVLFPPLE